MWFGNIDLGEMFVNYTLDLKLQPYVEIDVTELDITVTGIGKAQVFERWTITLMGFSSSAYIYIQTLAWSEEIIVGNRLDYNNPFYWDKVVLNLPGTVDIDPKMSIVYKWNSIYYQCITSFFRTYVDDIRSGGSTEHSCRSMTQHRIGCRINYLGQEVFMLEASEFTKRKDDGRNMTQNEHIVIPLMGRFKNEMGERNLVIVLANEIDGGLKIRRWIDRFTALLMAEGKDNTTGSAICNVKCYMLEKWRLNRELHNMLKQVP